MNVESPMTIFKWKEYLVYASVSKIPVHSHEVHPSSKEKVADIFRLLKCLSFFSFYRKCYIILYVSRLSTVQDIHISPSKLPWTFISLFILPIFIICIFILIPKLYLLCFCLQVNSTSWLSIKIFYFYYGFPTYFATESNRKLWWNFLSYSF